MKKNEYKPIQNDGTAYAKVLYTFIYLYRLYRNNVISKNHPCFTKSLYNLANVITASVLKKIYDASANKTIEAYRRENDFAVLDNIKYAVDNSTDIFYNKNGIAHTEIIDRDLYDSIHTNINIGMSERATMVQTVAYDIVRLCAKVPNDIVNADVKIKVNDKKYTVNFMTRFISYKALNNRVYIVDSTTLAENTTDKEIGFKTVQTTLLQLLHKKLRAYIDNNDSMHETNRKYTYLDKECTDENGNKYMYYERYLPSFAEFNFNANDSYTKGTKNVVTDFDNFKQICKDMKLTEKQSVILAYRMKDGGRYGAKAIATATGYSLNTVKSALRELRRKAVDIGLCVDIPNDVNTENTPIDRQFNLAKMNDAKCGMYAIEKAYSDGGKIDHKEKGDMFKVDKVFGYINSDTMIRIDHSFDDMPIENGGYNSTCKSVDETLCKPDNRTLSEYVKTDSTRGDKKTDSTKTDSTKPKVNKVYTLHDIYGNKIEIDHITKTDSTKTDSTKTDSTKTYHDVVKKLLAMNKSDRRHKLDRIAFEINALNKICK